jgi:peptide/nickel transport system substrate-binding protein
MWNMSWSMGANPNPRTLWNEDANFNLSNFTNPTMQSILDDIVSDNAWDPEFLADAYRRWAAAFEEYVPAVYNFWLVAMTTLNNRVVGYTLDRSTFRDYSFAWYRVGLTSSEPYVHRW